MSGRKRKAPAKETAAVSLKRRRKVLWDELRREWNCLPSDEKPDAAQLRSLGVQSAKDENWLLAECARLGDVATARRLLDAGVKVRPIEGARETAIHIAAARKKSAGLADALFDHRDDERANHKDKHGLSLFHLACRLGRCDVVQKFIDAGVDPSLAGNKSRTTQGHPLNVAIEHGQVSVAELLLRNGANPDTVDGWDRSLLYKLITAEFNCAKYDARFQRAMEMLRLLLEHGCDVNAKARDGTTAITVLLMSDCPRQLEVLEMLLKAPNVDLSSVDKQGNGYLHVLVRPGYRARTRNDTGLRMLRMLLERNLDPSLKNDCGKSPLDLAVLSYQYDAVKIILDHGCVDLSSLDAIDLKNGFGYYMEVPNYESTKNLLSIIQLLQERGHRMSATNELELLRFFIGCRYDPQTPMEHMLIYANESRCLSYLDGKEILYTKDFDLGTSYFIPVYVHSMYLSDEVTEFYNYYFHFLSSIFTTEGRDAQDNLDRGRIEDEIYLLEKTRIGNKRVTLMDLCQVSPVRAYPLLMNSKYEKIVDSDKFAKDFPYLGKIVKGYIAKSLIWRYCRSVAIKYVQQLTRADMPVVCCENIINRLKDVDLLNACEAVISCEDSQFYML